MASTRFSPSGAELDVRCCRSTHAGPAAAEALAALSADEVAERLVLDWSSLLRHRTFYKAVFRPSVLRANRLAAEAVDISRPGGNGPMLPPGLKFHALRHTYASLCVAAGIPPLYLSRFTGHAKVTTTLAVYTHLFDDDHAETMAALEATSRPFTAPNVVPMRRRSWACTGWAWTLPDGGYGWSNAGLVAGDGASLLRHGTPRASTQSRSTSKQQPSMKLMTAMTPSSSPSRTTSLTSPTAWRHCIGCLRGTGDVKASRIGLRLRCPPRLTRGWWTSATATDLG